jgi:hypothetical protein
MAGERKQKERINAQPRTPKKPKVPERPVIGSSSTWKKEQLVRFKVQKGVADAKTIVPEKWFNFETLERYHSGIPRHRNIIDDSTRAAGICSTGRSLQ